MCADPMDANCLKIEEIIATVDGLSLKVQQSPDAWSNADLLALQEESAQLDMAVTQAKSEDFNEDAAKATIQASIKVMRITQQYFTLNYHTQSYIYLFHLDPYRVSCSFKTLTELAFFHP